ncbi:hypothetical protein L211DRAFT_31201 [Terfezia boudieri ATCC MYA-4762]|uniref:Uncharacterized protein n=1 Tax=Terfezia boudieri ATCC MYA-4762 TaxID=1051890 RepID=A0A3N4M389_9PEZI|nr:hypothetical protein L211DRAFT_31201 [Terfezia boudieri ATCC MYA-4762]
MLLPTNGNTLPSAGACVSFSSSFPPCTHPGSGRYGPIQVPPHSHPTALASNTDSSLQNQPLPGLVPKDIFLPSQARTVIVLSSRIHPAVPQDTVERVLRYAAFKPQTSGYFGWALAEMEGTDVVSYTICTCTTVIFVFAFLFSPVGQPLENYLGSYTNQNTSKCKIPSVVSHFNEIG